MNYIQYFHEGLYMTVNEFQKNPFNFLYERDLQAYLYKTLYDKFTTQTIKITGGYHNDISGLYDDMNQITTNPVKCEYPISQIFDIALIVDESRVRHFDSIEKEKKNWKNDTFWDQPVKAAIEIKYFQIGDKLYRKRNEVEKDIKKLNSYVDKSREPQFLGISLLFIQSEKWKSKELKKFYFGKILLSDSFPRAGIYQYIVTPRDQTLLNKLQDIVF